MFGERREDEGRSIVPHDRAERDEFVFAPGRLPARVVSRWGSKIIMVLVVAGGAMRLTHFASAVSKMDQNVADGNQAGSGIIVDFEVLHIWLPPTFLELANRQSPSGVLLAHEDLQRFLEVRCQEKLWYAMTTRGHLANGEIVDLPLVRQPYNEPSSFPLFQKILAAAAQNPFDDPTDEFSSASIHVLTDELVKCEIRDVMAELKRNPYALVGLEHRRDFEGQ